MRHTGPVTQREVRLAPNTQLVSTTDLKGRILHCNAAFVEASGYAREELLGQPHNLIRHPDMPEGAFGDLWRTLQAGRPWTALVKNRRKDGDHYWVRANVTPIIESGACVGYLSVRTHAAPAETEAAGRLYARLREQERGERPVRLALVGGRVRRVGWRGLGERAADALALHATTVVPAALALLGWGLAQALPALPALGAAALAGLAGAGVLQRRVERPLQQLVRAARRLAAGDLTQRLASERADAVGQLTLALNQTSVNLQSIVADAWTEIERMEGEVGEIAAGNESLSGRTESQASSLEQTSAAMASLSTALRDNTEAARSAAALADRTAQLAADGAGAVDQVRGTIGTIDAASRRIADITQVIESISFQTNLLALNAAVEAARAGAQGRGFAVVAAEVRALAQRTREAAHQVGGIVESTQTAVAGGVELAARASARMADALRSVREVSQCVHTIQQASESQQTGIDEVDQAVGQLNGYTQQNAAMVEQLASTSMALRDRAEVLRASMQVMRSTPREQADAVALRRQGRAASRQPACA